VASAELFFDYLLNERIEDFRNEVFVMLDNILQNGFAVVKVFWDFRSRIVKRILKFDDLPAATREITGTTPRLSNELFFQQGKLVTDKVRFRALMDQRLPQLKSFIGLNYGLDEKEDDDKEAFRKILDFFRNARKEVTYETREIESNTPRMAVINPEDITVPRFTNNIQDAPRVNQRVFLTEPAFKNRAKDHGWSEKAVKFALEHREPTQTQSFIHGRQSSTAQSKLERSRDVREGLQEHSVSNELIEVWEHHTWMEIKGEQRRVSYPIHPASNTLLRDIRETGFEHGWAPFVQIKFEINDNRFYSSRGVPEKIDDIDVEVTTAHRSKLNQMDMLAPTFTYRMGSQINPDNFHFIPGEMYGVLNHDDIQPLEVPDRTLLQEREENILLTWNERYLGGFETLANQQNISEARTATEVNALQRSASEILSYRAQLVQLGMKQVYQMFWSLWNQWGPQHVFIQITGDEYKKVTKEEIRGSFDIVPSGTIDNLDPQQEAQRAFIRFQTLVGVAAQGPEVLGLKWELDVGQALVNWLKRDSAIDAQTVIRERDPEEIRRIQEAQAERQKLIQEAEDGLPMTPDRVVRASKIIEKRTGQEPKISAPQSLRG